jgi:hypothetical protein
MLWLVFGLRAERHSEILHTDIALNLDCRSSGGAGDARSHWSRRPPWEAFNGGSLSHGHGRQSWFARRHGDVCRVSQADVSGRPLALADPIHPQWSRTPRAGSEARPRDHGTDMPERVCDAAASGVKGRTKGDNAGERQRVKWTRTLIVPATMLPCSSCAGTYLCPSAQSRAISAKPYPGSQRTVALWAAPVAVTVTRSMTAASSIRHGSAAFGNGHLSQEESAIACGVLAAGDDLSLGGMGQRPDTRIASDVGGGTLRTQPARPTAHVKTRVRA